MRTMHGIHVHGFPNLFIVQPTQGANLISNVPHNLTEAGKTIATIVQHALDSGADEVEVTAEAEDAWLDLLLVGPGHDARHARLHARLLQQRGPAGAAGQRRCVGYPAGAMAYFQYIDAVARDRATSKASSSPR